MGRAQSKEVGGANEAPAPVQVRSDFRATALFAAEIHHGKDGKARVKVKFPESLTSWRATARRRPGQPVRHRQRERAHPPALIVRLEAPRFFVVGDTVSSAVVNNNTESHSSGRLRFGEGVLVDGLFGKAQAAVKTAPCPAGEARADWVVRVRRPARRAQGPARAGALADGKQLPFYGPHDIEKTSRRAASSRATRRG